MHGEADYSFTREEYDRRFERARERIAACKLDALLVSQLENHHYFGGLTYYEQGWSRYMYIWPNLLIIPRDGEPEAIAHHIFQANARSCYPFGNVEVWAEGTPGDEPEYVRILEGRLRTLGLGQGRIGAEMGDDARMDLGPGNFRTLVGRMPGAQFVDATPLIGELRAVKSPAEVEHIRTACSIQDQAIARLRERVHEGMRGNRVRNIFFEEVSRGSGRPLWGLADHFGGKMGSGGPEGSHDGPLMRGEVFGFDFGTQYGAYQADYGRTWIVGPPSGEQIRDHEATVRAVRATVEACTPGAVASDIVKACYTKMEKAGTVADTIISTSGFLGHGIGLSMVERPHLTLHSREELRAGTVLCLEPSVRSAFGWFNLEQMILLTSDGAELLSRAPTDFYEIPVGPGERR